MSHVNEGPTPVIPISQVQERKTKKSTACGPCRKARTRCDHTIPCSSCKNSSKIDKYIDSPPSSLTPYQQLIKPNSSFVRVTKPSHRAHSIATSNPIQYTSHPMPTDSAMSSPTDPSTPPSYMVSPTTPYHQQSPISSDTKTLREKNAFLLNQIQTMEKDLAYLRNQAQQPKYTDLYNITPEQLDFLRRMFLDTKLPPKNIVDFLVSFFFDNSLDQSHIIHVPTFKRQYDAFWSLLPYDDGISKIDPLYISLLFAVLASALVYVPSHMIRNDTHFMNYFKDEAHANVLLKDWFDSSRQLLAAYDNDSEKPDRLAKIQIMVIMKIYLSNTEQFELLDTFFLPHAVMCAYRFKLDSPSSLKDPSLSVLEIELRKRAWWDMCCYDTDRALRTGRKPLVLCSYSNVPFPENCNDEDVENDRITPKPYDVQTDASFIILQAKLFKALNSVFNIHLSEDPVVIFKKLNVIDQQLSLLNKSKPAFYKVEGMAKHNNKLAAFQANLIHMQICANRFRLYVGYVPLHFTSSIPQKICQTSIDLLLKKFKFLQLFYDIDKEILFLNQLEKVTCSLTLLLISLLSKNFNNTIIQQDIKMLFDHLTAIHRKQILFIRPQNLSNSMKLLLSLKERAESCTVELNKVSLDVGALVGDNASLDDIVRFENNDLECKPTKEELQKNISQIKTIRELPKKNIFSFNDVMEMLRSIDPDFVTRAETSHRSFLCFLEREKELD